MSAFRPGANESAFGSGPAAELVEECRAIEVGGVQRISHFDERRVQSLGKHIAELEGELHQLAANPHINWRETYFSAPASTLMAAMHRDVRALATYLNWRLHRIEDAWWSASEHSLVSGESDALDSTSASRERRTCAAEQEYLRTMNDCLTEYANTFNSAPGDVDENVDPTGSLSSSFFSLDLRSYLTRPPSCPPGTGVVEVKALQSISYTSAITFRSVDLYPGVVCSMPYEEAESLLLRGIVELLQPGGTGGR